MSQVGVVSPSEIATKNGLHISYWFNVGIMQQMLQEIEEDRGALSTYFFDDRTTAHPVAEIVNNHNFYKLCFGERW